MIFDSRDGTQTIFKDEDATKKLQEMREMEGVIRIIFSADNTSPASRFTVYRTFIKNFETPTPLILKEKGDLEQVHFGNQRGFFPLSGLLEFTVIN